MPNYPSNISREQFQLIREDLKNARMRTRSRKVDPDLEGAQRPRSTF